MKRALDVGGLLDAGIDVMEKRRKVKHETYNKWLVQYDREYQTKTWLDCETEMDAGSKVVNKLKCRICTKHSDRITGRRNFSDKWIVGADCVKTTNIRDHSKSDQHIHAMNLERRDQTISESMEQNLATTLSSAGFFSILMDGSTDASNTDNELFLVMWCDPNGSDEEVHSALSYLCIDCPVDGTAKGLLGSLQHALERLDIQSISRDACKRLVGIGTDGASVNIADQGLKGLVEREIPWVYWSWCLAHRLELAIKDALKGTLFDSVDEMLLRLYYIYEKSPKKCRELEGVVNDLKNCFEFDDNGVKPVRSSGTRWISHKLNAMKRVLSKYGAYTAHLTTLSEDTSVKSVDRAKLKGYLKKWLNAKYLLGCAAFVDLLTPCSYFSKTLQGDNVDILGALTALLRTIKETNQLRLMSVDQWPTYSATMLKIMEEDSQPTYQLQALSKVEEAKAHFQSQYEEYCLKVTTCILDRLAWSDLPLIRDIIFMLGTQGWQKIIDDGTTAVDDRVSGDEIQATPRYALNAIDRIAEHFKVPLEDAGVDLISIKAEYEGILSYSASFISLSTMDYQSVWWRLFHSPNSLEWSNVLTLTKLLYSLPVSNGKVERIFSQSTSLRPLNDHLFAIKL